MSGQGTPGSPRRASEEMDELPPPSWEQLDGERRRSEAHDRRNLALPVDTSGGTGADRGAVFEEDVAVEGKVDNGTDGMIPGLTVEEAETGFQDGKVDSGRAGNVPGMPAEEAATDSRDKDAPPNAGSSSSSAAV